METPSDDKQRQEEAVRRVVGVAALRKLRRMVDDDRAHTFANRALSRKLLTAILIIAALGLGFLLKNSMFG